MLRHLEIQLEEGSPQSNVIEMLTQYNYLRVLNISCCPLNAKLSLLVDIKKYRVFAVTFIEAVLETLGAQTHLKELTVTTELNSGFPYVWCLTSFRGMPTAREDMIQKQFPMKLETLKLSFPVLLHNTQLLAWKSLLDGQNGLKDLKLDFGFLYWRYFLQVLANNSNTLQNLDLSLSNYVNHRNDTNWNDEIHVSEQFNWTEVLSRAQELRSLRVCMSNVIPRFMEHPHQTKNLVSLQLNNLSKLELHFVALQITDLYHIFKRFPNLTNVELTYWNDSENLEYTMHATNLFIIIKSVLDYNQFEFIKLTDWSIRCYPSELREYISSLPNYISSWPRGTERTIPSFFMDSKNTFKIKRIE